MDLFSANRLASSNPFTNVYGLGRSVIAFGTLLTLLFNDTNLLFKTAQGIPDCPLCFDLTKITIFCLFKSISLNLAKWISILILCLVISGWRPYFTGLLHWWVSFSLNTSAIVLDGRDQVASVITLLLIPLTLADRRKNHWVNDSENRSKYLLIVGNLTIILIQLQVSVIYFHAVVGKIQVEEWISGTALYYFLQDPLFSDAPTIIIQLFKSPFILTGMTWIVLLTEIFLSVGLFLDYKHKRHLLYLGIAFHLVIILVFGLVTFACSMIGALIIYLMPQESDFFKGRFVGIYKIALKLRQRVTSKYNSTTG